MISRASAVAAWLREILADDWLRFTAGDRRLAMSEAAAVLEEAAWRRGDENAKSGDLIEAAFGYHHVITKYRYYEYAVVCWDAESNQWLDTEQDVYDGPNDELPTWYRPFTPPPEESPDAE